MIAVVALDAGYEALVALGGIGLGREPGAGPPGDDVAVLSAIAALVAGSALLAVAAGRPQASWPVRPGAVLAAPVAAAFVVARWYSYDPYYAPSLRRMSDGGIVSGRWIALVVASAIAAALVGRRNPGAGAALAAPLLLVFAATALVAGLGH